MGAAVSRRRMPIQSVNLSQDCVDRLKMKGVIQTGTRRDTRLRCSRLLLLSLSHTATPPLPLFPLSSRFHPSMPGSHPPSCTSRRIAAQKQEEEGKKADEAMAALLAEEEAESQRRKSLEASTSSGCAGDRSAGSELAANAKL